jgi:integrase
MASLSTDSEGNRRIIFQRPDGMRKQIRLGSCSKRDAEGIQRIVEQLLEAMYFNRPMPPDVAQRVNGLDDRLAKKLAAVGLIPSRAETVKTTLGGFLDAWLASRKSDHKPGSIISWGQVIKAIKGFFGEGRLLTDVTPADAEAFRQSLVKKLRATTINKRLQHARMFFNHAVRQQLLEANPFKYVSHRPGDQSERRAYVEAADVLRAIDHAPNVTWKLLIALSRFAGLRMPSEAFSLRWVDVDWERGRLTVPSPKTEHIPGKAYRVIPLFPQIRPYLEAAFESAPVGAEYVVPEDIRKRAQGPGGWANANLRTQFQKIIRRAGLEAWPRLWHSLRASCETDLSREYPLAVAAKWLGNTKEIAMRHYVDVTDADFERAAQAPEKAARKAAQNASETVRNDEKPNGPRNEKSPEIPGFSEVCLPFQNIKVEDNGLELPRNSRCFSHAGAPEGAQSGALELDHDLSLIVAAWAELPAVVRAGIVATVRAVASSK